MSECGLFWVSKTLFWVDGDGLGIIFCESGWVGIIFGGGGWVEHYFG